mmetsp:Transcript_3612/g.7389  ORF Transcript_3612/g.7389 Transcript_3612/m.7389 type:complete len:85 (-) Transcript_3612:1260-1514(-)
MNSVRVTAVETRRPAGATKGHDWYLDIFRMSQIYHHRNMTTTSREREREKGVPNRFHGNAVDRSEEPRRRSPPGGFLYESIVDC